MKNLIITNNPAVAEKNNNTVLFVDGSVEETLIMVRDKVHSGYELISHPLAASLRMMFSPFRSVILGKKSNKIDVFSAEIIEDSIIKYKRHMDFRKKDSANCEDYKMIDLILLESAIHEQAVTW
ncbi:GrdX family protein [Desulfosporosinus nitroreducens]|uniref:GrdX family protein n=1 Tax=Desulfosporosinus nitroreducens TaxID=2018668 RepID=A0ABT8R109_9FIRM|nr:GrdX family protein [Desulfosporosinus nitroreducens]MDO0825978.1 GrdX family protein [Desulfosporosinus nitroreducens]